MNIDEVELKPRFTAKPRAPKVVKLAMSLQDSLCSLAVLRPGTKTTITSAECELVLHAFKGHLGSGLPGVVYRLLAASSFVRNEATKDDSFAGSAEINALIGALDPNTGLVGGVLRTLKPKSAKGGVWLEAVLGFSTTDKDVIAKFLTKGLSEDQADGFNRITEWLDEPWASERAFFTLLGSAGTGKTFMLRRVLTYIALVNPELRFRFTAPTNKATKVLKAAVDKDAVTIYSVLKMSMVEDEDKAVLSAGDTETLDIPFNSLVGVDEASMLSTPVVSRLVTVANSRRLKVT